jgi:folate-binding protein YgfZ
MFAFDRDAVVAHGPDAIGYLQGQLSQDVAALEVGASAWSWILQPAGKVDALVRVTRTGPDVLLVDVDKGWGEAVLTRLARFKLRTKAELVLTTVSVLAVRGAGALDEAGALAAKATADGRSGDESPFQPVAIAVKALWPESEDAGDVLFRNGTAITGPSPLVDDGTRWDAARIAAGVPVMGAELTERTIPAETGLVDQTASFTKGCYTGQELVARIDSRGGNVPRHLRGLRAPLPLFVGTELFAGGKVVGTVTSAAVSPTLGPIGLAYVGRAVSPGATVGAGADGGPQVEVVGLPIPA